MRKLLGVHQGDAVGHLTGVQHALVLAGREADDGLDLEGLGAVVGERHQLGAVGIVGSGLHHGAILQDELVAGIARLTVLGLALHEHLVPELIGASDGDGNLLAVQVGHVLGHDVHIAAVLVHGHSVRDGDGVGGVVLVVEAEGGADGLGAVLVKAGGKAGQNGQREAHGGGHQGSKGLFHGEFLLEV